MSVPANSATVALGPGFVPSQRISEALAECQVLSTDEPSRALSLTITKLEEGAMWLGYHEYEQGRPLVAIIGTDGEDISP